MILKNKLIIFILIIAITAITLLAVNFYNLKTTDQLAKNYVNVQIHALIALMEVKATVENIKSELLEIPLWKNDYHAQHKFSAISEQINLNLKALQKIIDDYNHNYNLLYQQLEKISIWEEIKIHLNSLIEHNNQILNLIAELNNNYTKKQQIKFFNAYSQLMDKFQLNQTDLEHEFNKIKNFYLKYSNVDNTKVQNNYPNYLLFLIVGIGIFLIILLSILINENMLYKITNKIKNNNSRAAFVRKFPLFVGEEKYSRARLSSYIDNCRELTFQAGDVLFKAGDKANNLYLLQEGTVMINENGTIISENSLFAKEAIIDNGYYLYSAVAQTPVKVLSLDRNDIHAITETNPQIKNNFCSLMLDQKNKISESERKKEIVLFIGWLSAIIIPFLIYFINGDDFKESQLYFLMLFSSTLCIWIFNLLPEYMGAIFIIVGTLILGLAPVEVILSGYSSSSFFMALSVFALGSVIVQSGLIYRISILLLYYLPPRPILYEIVLIILGIILTPLLPSANGRVSLLTPLLIDIIETMGYRKGGQIASRLATAVFSGLSLYSASFLTSKSVNFAVFELLPNQVAEQFNLSYWFTASFVSFVTLLILQLIFSLVIYRNEEVPSNKHSDIKNKIKLQLNVLGKLTFNEWSAIIFIIIFIVGLMTVPTHKIQPSWIGLGILFGLVSLGSFSTKDFKVKIDWPFLFMLAGLIGMVQVMSALGIEKWISSYLIGIGALMGKNFYLFVLVLSLVTFLLRFILPNNASIILLLSDTWFMSYQCTYYQAFNELTDKKQIYNKHRFLVFNLLTTAFRIIAIYVSIPFWRVIGLL